MSAKIIEAQEHVKAAEKMLRTTILRWNPDHDSAADLYSQAAQCYRIAKEMKLSMECHKKAAESYKLNHSFFHSAKALENAILVGRNISSTDEMYQLACDSSNLYQQHGSGDSGAAVLAKTAKILEESDPEKACILYQKAAESSFGESSTHSAAEFTSKASRILVRLGRYEEAMDSVRGEVRHHLQAGNYPAVGRLVVLAVMIQAARGDVVAASKAFREWGVHCEGPEKNTIEMLIQGMEDCDGELMKRALNSPFIRSMDVEYARLAISIRLPEAEQLAPSAREGAEANVSPGTGDQAAARPENSREDAFEAEDLSGPSAGGSLC